MSTNRLSSFGWTGPRIARLIRLNVWVYVISNLVFNALVPYLNFEDPAAVYLFRGDQCIARFALPMVLLVPFLISVDILKKIIEAAEKGKAAFHLPAGFRKYPFIMKTALWQTLIIAVPLIVIILALPAKRTYGGEIAAAILGISAASIAGYAALRAVARLRTLIQEKQSGYDR